MSALLLTARQWAALYWLSECDSKRMPAYGRARPSPVHRATIQSLLELSLLEPAALPSRRSKWDVQLTAAGRAVIAQAHYPYKTVLLNYYPTSIKPELDRSRPCKSCGAAVGERCTSSGGWFMGHTHTIRRKAAA